MMSMLSISQRGMVYYSLMGLKDEQMTNCAKNCFECPRLCQFSLVRGIIVIIDSTFVMRSRGISRKLHMWHFQFSTWLKSSLERYILLITPSESDHRFQSYEQLKDLLNNRKQKKWIPFSGCISQSMLPTWLILLDHNTFIRDSTYRKVPVVRRLDFELGVQSQNIAWSQSQFWHFTYILESWILTLSVGLC